MDFDKQRRNGAPMNLVNKGRGFMEKPLIKPTANHRQTRGRPASRKITNKTQFVITSNRDSSRRMVLDRNGGSLRSGRPRNENSSFQMRGQRRFNGNQRNPRRAPRPANRNTNRVNRRNDNRRPQTKEDMDRELEKYFEKDEAIMKQRLDNELEQYRQQGQMSQQAEATPMTQMQPMQ